MVNAQFFDQNRLVLFRENRKLSVGTVPHNTYNHTGSAYRLYIKRNFTSIILCCGTLLMNLNHWKLSHLTLARNCLFATQRMFQRHLIIFHPSIIYFSRTSSRHPSYAKNAFPISHVPGIVSAARSTQKEGDGTKCQRFGAKIVSSVSFPFMILFKSSVQMLSTVGVFVPLIPAVRTKLV